MSQVHLTLADFQAGLSASLFSGVCSDVSNPFNRAVYQTSVPNGNTYLTVIPNGTAVGAGLDLVNASAGSDYLIVRLALGAAAARFNQILTGAATYRNWEWAIGGVPYLTMFPTGRIVAGASASDDGTNAFRANGTAAASAPADGATTDQLVTADWINRNMAAAIAAAYPNIGGL